GFGRSHDCFSVLLALRDALLDPYITVFILVNQRRRGVETKRLHQVGVGADLADDVGWRVLHGRDAAFIIMAFGIVQFSGRVLGGQDGRGLGKAVGFQDGNQYMAYLDLAGFDPGAGHLPEMVAIRAVGVDEHVYDARCIVGTVADPGGVFELRPGFLILGVGDQFL